jgi:hypothetical protein
MATAPTDTSCRSATRASARTDPDAPVCRPESNGAQGMNAIELLGAILQHPIRAPILQVEAVLHRHDRREALRLFELVQTHVGKPM